MKFALFAGIAAAFKIEHQWAVGMDDMEVEKESFEQVVA